jgi:hypothetical protein
MDWRQEGFPGQRCEAGRSRQVRRPREEYLSRAPNARNEGLLRLFHRRGNEKILSEPDGEKPRIDWRPLEFGWRFQNGFCTISGH